MNLPDKLDNMQLVYGSSCLGERSWGFAIYAFADVHNLGSDENREKIHFFDVGEQIDHKLHTFLVEKDPKTVIRQQECKQEVEEWFQKANLAPVFIEVMPNQYCKDPCCYPIPWFKVTSRIGHIVIGWRKRVVDIDWTNTLVKKNGKELFPDENVTRGDVYGENGGHYIHAWGGEKVVEYLKVLATSV